MNLKNYTSTVQAEKSVALIEKQLITIGATNISKNYKDGKLVSIVFHIDINDLSIPIKLPARIDEVEKYLINQRKRYLSSQQKEAIKSQAERTAWKIIYEWVCIQTSMIELKQAEFLEVFLPYAYNAASGQTCFETFKEKNYAGLLPAPKSNGG